MFTYALYASRIDHWHALITGPEDTPYEGGCFIFDIVCGTDYPNTAPKVLLFTTGGGTVRFNPNLYFVLQVQDTWHYFANMLCVYCAHMYNIYCKYPVRDRYNCGKVCLSLLGTWSGGQGEQWDPNVSSLLQVLISIQALIFVRILTRVFRKRSLASRPQLGDFICFIRCALGGFVLYQVPQPYFNEPGYESTASTQYATPLCVRASLSVSLCVSLCLSLRRCVGYTLTGAGSIGTPEGDRKSFDYNAVIREATGWSAILNS